MSISLRLTLALGSLLIATLLAMISALLLDGRHRVRNEVLSPMRATELLLRSSLSSLSGASDVSRRVERLVASLKDLRHVEIALASQRSAVATADDRRRSGYVPYSIFAAPTIETAVVPVISGGREIDRIIISARGSDEMGEVWETIGRISIYALGLAVGGFALTTLLVNRALAPVNSLGRALHLMEEGDYNIAVPVSGPPEIAAIGSEINALASALQRAKSENVRLSTAIITIQDEERRDIARELHDELGPHLFSIRASGGALIRALEKDEVDRNKVLAYAEGIQQQIDALQSTNRRVLQHLNPIGLDELGLAGALEALVAVWRNSPSGVEVVLTAAGELNQLDRTVTLTVYRMVQEGLTNAFQHAGATRIDVSVVVEPEQVQIIVRDNGNGLTDDARSGFGLKGMRDRVNALGGTLIISAGPDQGVELAAAIPKRSAATASRFLVPA